MQKCQMHFCYSAFANQEINTNTCLFYSLRVEVNVIIFSLSNYCSFFNKNCLNLTRGVTKKISSEHLLLKAILKHEEVCKVHFV